MTLDQVVPELFRIFPELKVISEQALSEYGEMTPDPYPVFSDVLRPAAYAALDRGDDLAARGYFAFCERALAEDTGRNLHDLIGIEIIEDLVEDPARLALAWPILGGRLREAARAAAQATKREAGRDIWLPE